MLANEFFDLHLALQRGQLLLHLCIFVAHSLVLLFQLFRSLRRQRVLFLLFLEISLRVSQNEPVLQVALPELCDLFPPRQQALCQSI